MFRMFSDLPAFRRDTLGFVLDRGATGDPLVRLDVGPKPVYLVTNPTVMRQVLKADEADIDKGRLVYKLREIVGDSSLIISGAAHRARRGAIHKALAEGVAGDYVPQIGAVVRNWAATLASQDEIDAHQSTASLALRIICTILFGSGALTEGDQAALVEAVHLVEDDLAEGMFRLLPHTPWAYARKKRKLRWAKDIMGLVVERTRKRAAANSLFTTFETMGLQGSDLQDEILMLLLAGHHTSGSAAAWLLYHLAADHGLAGRLADEARRISDQDGELTPLAIRSAPLSRAFVQEILRLYPSTYWTSRELRRDQDVGGQRLRRGTSLMLSPWQMHRDPRYWSEPARFDLTRSWTSNPAYMPFGFGGRACVGLNVAMLELQLIALEFALCFEARLASPTLPGPPKPSVTLVPPAIRLRLQARLDKLGTHEFAA